MFRTHPRVKEFVGSCMKKEVIELSRPELFVSNVELGFKFARIILIIILILILILILIHIIQQITEQGNECMSEFREMMGGLNSKSLDAPIIFLARAPVRKRKWRNAVKLRGCYALLLFLDEQGFTLTVHFEHARGFTVLHITPPPN